MMSHFHGAAACVIFTEPRINKGQLRQLLRPPDFSSSPPRVESTSRGPCMIAGV